MYKLSADHQTLSSRGKMTFNSSTYGKSLEFGPADKYLFFTINTTGTVVNMKRVAVSSFSTSAAVLTTSASAQAMDNRSTATIVSAIRRGINNALYYVTNTGGTDVDLRMFAASEDASISTASVSTSSNIRYLSQGAFPIRAHLASYGVPTSTVVMSGRTLKNKEYELKDHLGNVHMTVADYKVPYAGTSDNKYDERFNDGLTSYASSQYTVTAGSPGGTAVTNPDARMMVAGTSGSAVNKVITLTTGHKYLLGFDYQAGTCAAASYSLTNLSIGGSLLTDGRTEVTFDIGANSNINLQFTDNDPASSSAFYIDNILIKDLGTTLAISANTVLNEPFNSGTSYPWVATNAAISYSSNQMHVSGTPPVLQYAGVARTLDLMPGEIYRVRFDLTAKSVGTSTMSFAFSGGSATQYGSYDYSQPMTNGITTYTFYVTPNTVQSTFYINVTSPSSSFSWDIDNFIVEMSTASPKPLYTAVANDLTDYYAFGSPMPGRSYHASVPNAYRYGMNGKEKDNEISGDGNNYDFGARIYDSRLGRWLSTDPMQTKYPYLSPYNFVSNNPILNVEVDGKVFTTYITEKVKNETTGKLEKVTYKIVFDGTNITKQQVNHKGELGAASAYTGDNKFVSDIVKSYKYIVDNKADVDGAMQKLAESSMEVQVKDRAGAGSYKNGVIEYDFSNGLKVQSTDGTVDGIQSPALGFWSEAYHGYLDLMDKGKLEEFKQNATVQNPAIDREEEYIHVEKEHKVIDALKASDPNNKEPKRKTHGDGWKNVKTKGATSTEKD